ncbi:hypothetical protein niasHS_009282 [Heterodera schachtii]|uniref:Sulfotransferase n=1 Tax=Heterodera schachtii TaxID=97005 RepID=A0ABD2IZ20_HETSC
MPTKIEYEVDIDNPELLLGMNTQPLPTKSHFGTFNEDWDSICGSDGQQQQCVRKFDGKFQRNVFIPSLKLAGCLIAKNSNIFLETLFCYFANMNKLNTTNIDYILFNLPRIKKMFCYVETPYYSELSMEELVTNVTRTKDPTNELQLWKMVALVRDPIERFIAGFVDKCFQAPLYRPEDTGGRQYCNGCGPNLTCFVMTEYEKMLNHSSSNLSFVPTAEDAHFFPQNWLCPFQRINFTLIKYKSLAKAEDEQNFTDQFVAFLANIPSLSNETIEFVRAQAGLKLGHHTSGSTAYKFVKKRLYESPFLMEFLVRMFYWDFKVLGFPLPKLFETSSDKILN